MLNVNVCIGTDSYKLLHDNMMQPKTERVFSYFEAREGALFPNVTFYGLQYLLKEYLQGVVVTKQKIDEAQMIIDAHLGPGLFNRAKWEYIVEKHGGKLPVRIKAVPEGTTVPVSNVLMTVENTDDECYWLTNHLETWLSWVWYPSTVCTLSRETKLLFKKFLSWTADDLSGLPFKLHDFGYRGVSGMEAAGWGGSAHLVNFLGTDTIRAMEFALKYYNANLSSLGFSIPATEHSVMTSLGREGEATVYEQLLDKYPKGLLAIVSDSYDIYNAADQILGVQLKDKVLARDGTLVVRPDSGDPVTVVLKLLDILGNRFGYEVNKRGCKVLNPKIRLIWGDGIDYKMIGQVLDAMMEVNWSTDNICFGQGGALLQKVNRDTLRFAFKCCAQKRDGAWYDIKKDPIEGKKTSKAGRLALIKVNGSHGSSYQTVREEDCQPGDNLLVEVFCNGTITKEYSFEEVRANASI
jgi:nicotinamide phosphoribosyltransferase